MSKIYSIKKILILMRLENRHLEAIRAAAPEARIVLLADPQEKKEKIGRYLPETEVVLGNFFREPLDQILTAPNLRWMQQSSAGANWLMDHPAFVASEIVLTSASGLHAIPISEHILAFMFCLARDMGRSIRDQGERKWSRSHRVSELDGQTMGLIGLGAVGEKTAEKAKGLNMRVLAMRRRPERSSPWVDRMHPPEEFMEMLPEADWVVITAPLTTETKGMIGERELRAMKRSAFIINISRGPLIQEGALVTALREKWIAGAGLDVFEEEPLPPSSPLWEMENVLITAHYAGSTPYYVDRLMGIFLENLRRYRAGEPLKNVVNKKLGY